jgi:hypothetical protein
MVFGVHGPRGAKVHAFIEQRGSDRGGRAILEAFGIQDGANGCGLFHVRDAMNTREGHRRASDSEDSPTPAEAPIGRRRWGGDSKLGTKRVSAPQVAAICRRMAYRVLEIGRAMFSARAALAASELL